MKTKYLPLKLLLTTTAIFLTVSCSNSTVIPTTKSTTITESPSPTTEKVTPSELIKNIKGKISSYDVNAYHFTAQKGQMLTLTLKTNGDAEAFLFGYDDYRYGQPYALPETTEYEVRVAQPRNSARKNKTAEYDLMIEVK